MGAKSLIFSLFLPVALVLSGCSGLQFPGVYKVEVEQGNIVTQEQVDQLSPGLTRRQVLFVMGSPLIQDSFNGDRWDYWYSRKRGDEESERYLLTLEFADDQLVGIRGDFRPGSGTQP